MTDQDTAIVLSDETLSLVEELRSVRESYRKLKAREEEIREDLLTELKGIEHGLTADGTPVIEIDRQTRTRVDSKRLQALYEEVWEDCQTEMTVETVRLPEVLQAD